MTAMISDLDSYLNHCYDVLLHNDKTQNAAPDSELCACAKLVSRDDQKQA